MSRLGTSMQSAPDAVPPGTSPPLFPAWGAGIRRGDGAAFDGFYDATYERLRRFLLVLVRGREDLAHDALQEAYLRVLRYAQPWPDEAAAWRWLLRVARTALIDLLRREQRSPSTGAQAAGLLEALPAAGEDDTERLLLEALERARWRLSEEERLLLDAHYIDGVRHGDLAEVHDTTRKAVEMRLARIRARLRPLLLEELDHAP